MYKPIKTEYWVLLVIITMGITTSHSGRVSHSSESVEYTDEERTTSTDDEDEAASSSCGVEDGSHSATVDYHNPDTGHSATYDLEVEVEDCEVIQINFPRGGWLDDSHISPTELDSDGSATLEDDEGREYTIHIDN